MKKYNRITIKVGTSSLTHKNGRINLRKIESLAKVISDIKNSGTQVVLVSSGAISVGFNKMGLDSRPTEMALKQASAAVGQSQLMYIYDKFFAEYGFTAAQILLTKDVIDDPQRKTNIINTLNTLLSRGIIPIINENDSVSIEEIEFGDNDTLSALVSSLADCELLVILTDIEGLYDKDPRKYADAKLIHKVLKIDDSVRALAGGAGTKIGTGGMITKIEAASIAGKRGIDTVIANGDDMNILYDILDGKDVGTLFKAEKV